VLRAQGVTDAAGGQVIAPAEPLAEAIRRAGLEGVPTLTLAGDEERYLGFFEAHIEQGPFLEATCVRDGTTDGAAVLSGTLLRNAAGCTRLAVGAMALRHR
jgi:hypothetical protein